MIQDGKRFSGPIELIRHHTNNLDGLLTKPIRPCSREKGTSPMAWPGVTYLDLDQMILDRTQTLKLKVRRKEDVSRCEDKRKCVRNGEVCRSQGGVRSHGGV